MAGQPEPDPCRHCGVRHRGHPHLFCFSPRVVDLDFVRAAARGDLKAVAEALVAKAAAGGGGRRPSRAELITHVDVRARPRFHRTPTALHRAAAHGHEGVVAALLDAGAMVEPRSARFATPLHTCATAACAARLLQAGAHVAERDYSQATALVAARAGTYVRDVAERARLVAVLQAWQAEHEAPAPSLPSSPTGRAATKFMPGLSAAELELVLRTSRCKTVAVPGEAEEDGNAPECAICLADLVDPAGSDEPGLALVRLGCRHAFHEACLVPALRRSCCCPYCRQDVRRHSGSVARLPRLLTV